MKYSAFYSETCKRLREKYKEELENDSLDYDFLLDSVDAGIFLLLGDEYDFTREDLNDYEYIASKMLEHDYSDEDYKYVENEVIKSLEEY